MLTPLASPRLLDELFAAYWPLLRGRLEGWLVQRPAALLDAESLRSEVLLLARSQWPTRPEKLAPAPTQPTLDDSEGTWLTGLLGEAVRQRLFNIYSPDLRAMLERRLGPKPGPRFDPSDILQDAYLRACQRWDAWLSQPSPPLPPDCPRDAWYLWLYGLARDCLLDRWKREKSKGRDADREQPWPEESSLQLLGKGTGPLTAAQRHELQVCVQETIERLPPTYSEILWLIEIDGLSVAEAAAVLGIEPNNVSQRRFQARQRFAELWEQLHGHKDFGL